MRSGISAKIRGVVPGLIRLSVALLLAPSASVHAQTAPPSTPLPSASVLMAPAPSTAPKLGAHQSAYRLLGLDKDLNKILDQQRKASETATLLLCAMSKDRTPGIANCNLPQTSGVSASPPATIQPPASTPPTAAPPPVPKSDAPKLMESALRRPVELAPLIKPSAEPAPQQDTAGDATRRVIGSLGVGGAAFRGYQFSNVGTLAELQHGMRSLGVAESVIARDSPKLMQAIKSGPGRYGLLLVAVAGGGYALYEAWSSPAAKK